MNFTILKHTCLQPAPDQTDQTLISYSVLYQAEHPLVTQAPEEILEVGSNTHSILPPAILS